MSDFPDLGHVVAQLTMSRMRTLLVRAVSDDLHIARSMIPELKATLDHDRTWTVAGVTFPSIAWFESAGSRYHIAHARGFALSDRLLIVVAACSEKRGKGFRTKFTPAGVALLAMDTDNMAVYCIHSVPAPMLLEQAVLGGEKLS